MPEFVYYNHAYILKNPEVPVKENLTFKKIKNTLQTNGGGQQSLFASYITDFDVGKETSWWFTVKTDAYDLSLLPSKKRYEITKANKFCYAKSINPADELDAMFEVYKASFDGYDEKERPKDVNKESFESYIQSLLLSGNHEFYACYLKENDQMAGWTILEIRGKVIGLMQQKTIPYFEKYNTNASLIDFFLTKWNDRLSAGDVIISNGSRNIRHITNFNAYLEKYFGFRKAYSNLKIAYRFPIGIIVKLLMPFKWILGKCSNPFLYNVYCMLKMQEFSS
ncbi:hypothetical protein [Treponema peruense]|uniref:Acetyltransferase (GNAT) domain-containing protein n=1 Tax=Treponema peruense TaxID=2787628 RepID=A0A7T3RFD4_9SPIR|nr:hypothetical protein [Treponema peruense]QQA02131.1 hypothetical protein IWA51_06020 [Treponema peruense]